ncbi:MAG: hypothetical protein LBU88_03370 [Treponema sp.]|nr:hypothetical protein [Treponema sp.]
MNYYDYCRNCRRTYQFLISWKKTTILILRWKLLLRKG